MPHNKGSFSYKAINSQVKRILDARSELDNTIQVAMPFIKATTTIRLPEYLGENNIGFTIGTHATELDMKMEDMYSSKEGNALIGYTYGPTGKNQAVYVHNSSDAELANRLFDNGTDLVSNTNFSRIPPPGITKMTIGRNKNGLLAAGEIEISVPILSQLEALHRVFLVPNLGMVMEWGQQFAADGKNNYGEYGLPATDNINEYMFPWYDQSKRNDLFKRLALQQVGLDEILKGYVWPTQGQYMWMFGRVANFSTKANSDGSFTCNVKIVGPSEDAWAYSTRNTIIPPRSSKDALICPDGVNSVESFFTTTSTGKNLKTLLETTMSGGVDELSSWKMHVLKFDKPSNKDGQPTQDNNSKPSVTETTFADSEDAYFMTWRYFVNVVLNNDKYGVKSIFKDGKLTSSELQKIALLRPYVNSTDQYINDEYENYVGNNKYLRSVDPSVMIIVNDTAADEAGRILGTQRPALKDKLTKPTIKSGEFLSQGDFHLSVQTAEKLNGVADRGFLSTGVWLNHKAVVQCMASSDTILRGIINILDRMNQATMGYWQLTIDPSEPSAPTAYDSDPAAEPTSTNYTVIDANFRESAETAVANFIDKVHVFNKYIRQRPDGTKVGSDVLDCAVDLSLPKRLFTQIATTGLVQPNDVSEASGQEGDPKKESPIVGDPNETLRKMFSITTVTPKSDSDSGPDLTILSRQERASLTSGTCGSVNGQTTAGTAGIGVKPAPLNAEDAQKSPDDMKKIIEKRQEQLKKEPCDSATCKHAIVKATEPPVSAPPPAQFNESTTVGKIEYDSINGMFEVPIANDTGKSANAKALYGAGYRNGLISTDSLSSIGQGSHILYKDAADAFRAMAAAAKAEGAPLTVTDSYRPLYGKWSQIGCVKEKGWYSGPARTGYSQRAGGKGWCAQPGTSNHGWGLAVDIDVSREVNKNWLANRANAFGFSTIPNEPWHWEYTSLKALNTPIKPPVSKVATKPPVTPKNVPPKVTPTPQATPTPSPTVDCSECVRAQQEIMQYTKQAESNAKFDQGSDRVTREFPGLEDIFRYVEVYGDLMSANIARDADGNKSNAFGASPGTLSISADITLPGINGLRVGELFWIDRIPSFYKAYGAFQTLSIEDTIDREGWKTQIHARFNYMGNLWKSAMANRLQKAKVTASAQNIRTGVF